jgi:hypothetical protein
MHEEDITFQSLWMGEVSHIQVMDEILPMLASLDWC